MTNRKFRADLLKIIKEAGLENGCDKSIGDMLYAAVSKVSKGYTTPFLFPRHAFIAAWMTLHMGHVYYLLEALCAVPKECNVTQASLCARVYQYRENQGMGHLSLQYNSHIFWSTVKVTPLPMTYSKPTSGSWHAVCSSVGSGRFLP